MNKLRDSRIVLLIVNYAYSVDRVLMTPSFGVNVPENPIFDNDLQE